MSVTAVPHEAIAVPDAHHAGPDGSVSEPHHRTPGPRQRVLAALARRRAALAMLAVMFALGMAYTFGWNPIVHHSPSWTDANDEWGIFLGAHLVGWGYLGGIYNTGTGIVTFPGIAVILAPAAILSDWLHLTSSIGQFDLPRPTSLLLIEPLELLLAGSVIVAADALADGLGAPRGRRYGLVAVVGVLAFPVATVWGHAEDALALTFALYAMVAVLRANWRSAGWLFGCAIVVQPLVALTFPLFLATSPRGAKLLFVARSAVLSAFLVGVAWLGNPSGAYRALVQQPTPPSMNHPTPWIALAPKVAGTTVSGIGTAARVAAGTGVVHTATALHRSVGAVSGGSGRSIYLALALLLGVYVWRRPQDPVRLLWLAGLVLAARCFFEAVMTPYYLAPPLFLLLVLAARTDVRRFAGSVAVALGISWFAYWHFAPWVWWPPVVVGLLVILALAYPGTNETRGLTSDTTAAVGRARNGSDDAGPAGVDGPGVSIPVDV